MRTNIELDDELIAYVQREGGHKTKREAVEAALKEYRRRLAMRALLDMAGQVEFAASAAELRGKALPATPRVQEPMSGAYAEASASAAAPAGAPRKARGR